MTALSGETLSKLINKIPYIKNQFKGIVTRDLDLRPPNIVRAVPQIYIQNTGYARSGIHWILLVFEKEACFLFDSYGRTPRELFLENSIIQPYKSIHYNPFQLQDNGSSVCGHWCIYILYHLNTLSIYQINKFFTADHKKNDRIVLNFVSKLAKKWKIPLI